MKKDIQKSYFSLKDIQTFYTNIAKLITSSLEVSKITTAIMEQVELFFQPHNWSLLRVDASSRELFFVIAKGLDFKLLENVRIKIGEGIAGQVAKTGKAIFVQDVQNNPHFSQKIDQLFGFKTKSLIAVPIIFRNEVLGVIELINTLDERSFTNDELRILETIADFSAIALNNAIAYERLAWIANHDPLTGLYNRSYLEKLVTDFQSTNTGDQAIVVGIDVDKFKNVNDNYGHLAGDNVLIKTAKILKEYCHQNGVALRMGGDEFLLVIPNLSINDVAKKMEWLQEKLSRDIYNILPAKRFSFGITSGAQRNLPALVKQADSKMYVQKNHSNEAT